MRHSGSKRAWVRLRFTSGAVELDVEDHGCGFPADAARKGIGLVAMRERAEIVSGLLEIAKPETGGTLVRLRVPVDNAETHAG